MNKKHQIVVRLYRQYDLDLIALLLKTDILPLFTKGILKMYTAGKKELFQLPQIEGIPNDSEIHNRYTYTLYFDKEEDAKTLAMLERVREGYRNGFIKNVVRSYIHGGYCAYYFDDPRDTQTYFELMQSADTAIVPYDRFKSTRPDKVADQLLGNKGISFHTEDEVILESGIGMQENEAFFKGAEEEKRSVLKENTPEYKKEKAAEAPRKEKTIPFVITDKEMEPVEEPIILMPDEESELIASEDEDELEDLFASMMNSM